MISEALQRKEEEVWQKTEAWRKAGGFKHKKPCKEWLEGKRCPHYAKARYRHFKNEIDSMLQQTGLETA